MPLVKVTPNDRAVNVIRKTIRELQLLEAELVACNAPAAVVKRITEMTNPRTGQTRPIKKRRISS